MDDKQTIIAFLKKINFTTGMNDAEIAVLGECLSVREYQAGEVILKKHELSDDIYVILSGKAKVLISDVLAKEHYHIVELGPEERFGEISFRDGLPRSSTVKALQATKVIVISKKELAKNAECGNRVIDRIILNTAVQLSKRIRVTNDSYVDVLKQKIRQLNDMVQFGRMFVVITLFLGLSNIFVSVLARYYPTYNVRAVWFSWVYLCALFIPFLILVLFTDKPLSNFGVTLKRSKKSIREALMIIAVFAPALIYLCNYTYTSLITHFLNSMAFVYLVHASIQEFVARGVIQTTISNFMFDKKNILSIFLASFYFGIFHLHIGLQAFLLTFFVGFLFGYIFYRQKTLVGVIMVHFVLGWVVLGKLV